MRNFFSRSIRLLTILLAIFCLAACTTNPYTGEQQISKTGLGAGVGAAVGAGILSLIHI